MVKIPFRQEGLEKIKLKKGQWDIGEKQKAQASLSLNILLYPWI
jgi:hypothetical protein